LVSAGALTIARDPLNGRPTGTTAGVVSESRGYDLFGDVLSTTFQVNGANALSFQYTRDDLGRIATKTETDGAGAPRVSTYHYDALGNVREVLLPDGRDITYLIDGQGRRIAKLVSGVVVKQWLWRSGLQPVAELDGAGNLTARYVYTAGNVPSLMVTNTA